MARFSHRMTRLARQRESEAFRQFIMPFSRLIGFIGLLAMVLVLLDHYLNQRWETAAFVASASAAALPVVVLLFRWIRGHFNRQLENP
jgi:amino acid permease